MRISELGEFALIERFRRRIRTDSSVIKGSGDDCAVLKFDRARYQLFTCDMLVEGVDFYSQEDPFLVGRKSIAVSLSDIAACAGIPAHCLVSLGLPKKTSVSFTDKLFRGMLAMARRFNLNLVGGDLSSSPKLVIDVSMLGFVEKKYFISRGNARAGDVIFVSGTLGGSIFGRHLKFTPRVKEARYLVENFRINAMIDVSDGLAQDLGHILRQSSKGAVLFEDLLPFDIRAKGLDDLLYSGEDFELLFTASRPQAEKILRKSGRLFKPIGEIVGQGRGITLITTAGKERGIQPKGFRHF
ncbi:MAG: thiamine-phosphate kinase [Candidatus Omnitrophica bacterium]|nr:thiamine-phosphate kinase [Candidatus Omnitrophota bacterium]MDD5512765.1 thiamine-phosphate kinase [Candidatus Omnitrophota bacterium]